MPVYGGKIVREKTAATDDQFKEVLGGFGKVDKAMRISSPPATRDFGYYWGAGRDRTSVQCYYCFQFGHYQNSCQLRLSRRAGSDPPPLRGRFSDQLLK